jgi:uncharacterized Zn finger protein (UPF0148 family)
MIVTYIGSSAQVLLHDDTVARARMLGHNVGEALKMPYEEVKFLREDEQACPYCHNSLLKVVDGGIECPFCDIKGQIETHDGKIKVIFEDEELKKSRFTDWGTKRHDDERLARRGEYAQGKQEIAEKLQKYKTHKRATAPPPLKPVAE